MIDSSGNLSTVRFPLVKESSSINREYTFAGNINYKKFNQKKVHIVADDCVENILINGKNVSLSGIKGLCDWNKGFDIDLSGYLDYGENNINIKIKDYGGKFGLSVGNPMTDPRFMAVFVLIVLFYSPFIYLILRHVFKIKKMDNAIFILTMFIFAVSVRYYLFYFQSGDYGSFLSGWYDFIRANGGI